MGFPLLVRQNLYIESGPRDVQDFLDQIREQIPTLTLLDKRWDGCSYQTLGQLCWWLSALGLFPVQQRPFASKTVGKQDGVVWIWICCLTTIGITISKIKQWWRHQMETFSVYWPFVREIYQSLVDSPHKGQWRGALVFSLICAWTNGWANSRVACDLRRHHAHYNVTVSRPSYVIDKNPYTWDYCLKSYLCDLSLF